ncbi:MAG: helix-turn-helix domain-containing protein [Candidatus Omnitrophota bacterium]|nr:MAG: helix-turn-helix domain-containing protein [Candidatus Omnitrophota bacterium]
MSRVMTVHEVAKYLNMVPDTIYRKARAGEIPAVKMGKCWRFPKDTLDKWLNDRALESNGNGKSARDILSEITK